MTQYQTAVSAPALLDRMSGVRDGATCAAHEVTITRSTPSRDSHPRGQGFYVHVHKIHVIAAGVLHTSLHHPLGGYRS